MIRTSRDRRSWRALVTLAVVAALFGASSCCSSEEVSLVVVRGADDRGKTCEQVCGAIVASERTGQTESFLGCEDGADDRGRPAVICRYRDEVCTNELH